jgi:hypothetical protein
MYLADLIFLNFLQSATTWIFGKYEICVKVIFLKNVEQYGNSVKFFIYLSNSQLFIAMDK